MTVGQFFIYLLKAAVGFGLFFLLLGPFLLGLAINLLVLFIHVVSGLFLTLFANPLGILILGLLIWIGFRRKANISVYRQGRVVPLDQDDYEFGES